MSAARAARASSSRAESVKEITANKAQRLLDVARAADARSSRSATSSPAITSMTCPSPRHADARFETALADAVAASGTTLTDIFGIGPIVAAMIIGHTRNVARFASRDHFAAYCGTAPIEFASGGRSVHRLSLRGNRQLNHAMHIIAVTQIRAPTLARPRLLRPQDRRRQDIERSAPRTETPDHRRRVRASPRRPTRATRAREGKRGRLCNPAWPASHPEQPALRKNHSRTNTNATTPPAPNATTPIRTTEHALDNKEEIALALAYPNRIGQSSLLDDAH